MNLISIIGLAIIATIICLLFSQYKPEYTVLISVISSILIFGLIIIGLSDAFNVMKVLLDKIQINNKYTEIIVKSLGICYVTQLASDSCKDAGQTAIANKVELAGKVSIILISLPLFLDLLEISLKLVSI